MRRVTFKMRISAERIPQQSSLSTNRISFFYSFVRLQVVSISFEEEAPLHLSRSVQSVTLLASLSGRRAHMYLLWRVNLTRPAGWTRDKERTAHVREDALLRIDLLSKSRNLAYIGVSCVHAEMLLYRCESRPCRWNGLELLFCWRRLNRMLDQENFHSTAFATQVGSTAGSKSCLQNAAAKWLFTFFCGGFSCAWGL